MVIIDLIKPHRLRECKKKIRYCLGEKSWFCEDVIYYVILQYTYPVAINALSHRPVKKIENIF